MESNLKPKTKRGLSAHSKAVRFGLFLAGIVILLGVSGSSLNMYMKGRIMPFVKVQGVSVGGLKTESALAKLKTYYPDNRKLVFSLDNRNIGIPAKEIDAKVDLPLAVKQAYAVGRAGSWSKTIHLASSLDQDKLHEMLASLFFFPASNPQDASYTLTKDGQLDINPGHPSAGLDIPTTSRSLKSQIVNPGTINSTPVAVKKSAPTVTVGDLSAMKDQVQQYLNKPGSVLANGRVYTPKDDQKLSFIKIEMANGQPEIGVNDDNVKTYIESLNKKVEVSSRPNIYLPNGHLSQAGKPGLSLNDKEAFTQYKKSILGEQAKPVVLATTTTPPEKKTINAPYTLGRFAGKYIEIDLSSQKLYQIEGNDLLGSYGVSSGKRSTPTPVGTFSINSKSPRAFSGMYKLYMPYWMAFIGSKYGIHELPEWPNGAKEGVGHIGTPVSDGCVRLRPGVAKKVYDWAEIGTPVVIHQ